MYRYDNRTQSREPHDGLRVFAVDDRDRPIIWEDERTRALYRYDDRGDFLECDERGYPVTGYDNRQEYQAPLPQSQSRDGYYDDRSYDRGYDRPMTSSNPFGSSRQAPRSNHMVEDRSSKYGLDGRKAKEPTKAVFRDEREDVSKSFAVKKEPRIKPLSEIGYKALDGGEFMPLFDENKFEASYFADDEKKTYKLIATGKDK